ncbi:MAG TPA: hypothetical protein VNI60_10050, partial [Pyrinomonadaceae bacterium]|nr:hypothetical protein [Pyrinomonadaceae bacterium]
PRTLSQERNENLPKRIDQYPSLRDFYNDYDQYRVTDIERKDYQTFLGSLSEKERGFLNGNYYFYQVDLKNIGGLVMPLIFKVEYMDGASEQIRVPAEIWRYNNFDVSKLIVTRKEAKAIVLDPNLETADADLSNNFFPRRTVPSRFQVFKAEQQIGSQPNLMQREQQRNMQTTAPTGQQNQNAALNLTGRWKITVDAGGQTIPFTLDIVQQGGTITGSIESPQGTAPFTSGTLTADGFTLKATVNVGQPFAITLNGKAVGNQMSGTMEAPQGTANFTGSKAP